SIRMQLGVPLYKAISVDRGATLGMLDNPLNNRGWLKAQFAELRRQAIESERLAGLRTIMDWTNPGPGGFYDDLGNQANQPHLVRNGGFAADPDFLRAP